MPKDLEFEGTGHKGAGFEQKGQSERNLGNLLKTLGNKETQKAVERLGKIKKDQWEGINANLALLGDFMEGDAGMVFSQLKSTLTDTIGLKFGEILAPIKNEIYAMLNETLNEALEPIMPYINEAIYWVGVGLDALLEVSFNLGWEFMERLQQIWWVLAPEETPWYKAAEEERLAKARRARYQFANVEGPGGRAGGFQAGSGQTMGRPPDPPSTGSRAQE